MIKGWGGVSGGSRFESQWGQKMKKEKKKGLILEILSK